MAVPKCKTSKARRNSRAANWKIEAVNLVECPNCHTPIQSHRVCPNCGYQFSNSGFGKGGRMKNGNNGLMNGQDNLNGQNGLNGQGGKGGRGGHGRLNNLDGMQQNAAPAAAPDAAATPDVSGT